MLDSRSLGHYDSNKFPRCTTLGIHSGCISPSVEVDESNFTVQNSQLQTELGHLCTMEARSNALNETLRALMSLLM